MIKYTKSSGVFRIFVRFIDYVILFLIANLILILLNIDNLSNLKKFYLQKSNTSFFYSWDFNIFYVLLIFIIFIYFVIIPCINNGQTLSKSIFKIKCISNNNNNPKVKFIQILKRELLISLFPIILIIFLIIYANITNNFNNINLFKYSSRNFITNIFMWLRNLQMLILLFFSLILLFSKSKIGIHDLIGKTLVINKRTKKDKSFASSKNQNLSLYINPEKIQNEEK